MTQRLDQRVSVLVVTIATVVTVFVISISLGLAFRAAMAETHELKVIQTRVLASNLTAALAFNDKAAATGVLETLDIARDIVMARILISGDQVFAEYRNYTGQFEKVLKGSDPFASLSKERFVSKIQQPVIWQGAELGVLEIWVETLPSNDLVRDTLLIASLAIMLAALLAYLLARRLGRRVLQPVREISSLMLDMTSREDYTGRFQDSTIQEINTLGESLNSMLLAIEDRENSLQRAITALEIARDEAQHNADTKTSFLANMSHEIRTPMNGVIGMVSLIKETQLSGRQRVYFDTIEKSAAGLLVVIDDILDFTKLESGHLKIRRMPFSLNDLLGTLNTIFEIQANSKGLEFQLTTADGLPNRVIGDPARLRQLLMNLIGNAIKFTDAGSVKLVVTAVVKSGEPLMRFEVIDTGIGIAEDKQAGIFNEFYQVDLTSTRAYGGTGLGLAICRELARLMEGTVSFQSSTEKGSRFWLDLRLPADELNPFAVPPAIEPGLDLNPFSAALSGARNEIALTTLKENGHQPTSSFTLLRVLVVDDSEVNRFILCELLATLGVKATVARNGEEAVAAFSRSALDIILMDIQMPVMDGVAATAAIQRLQAEQNMNPDCIVVGVSAHAMSGDREKYLASGMADYLTKPIDRKNLESCLSALAKELRGDIHLWR
ncbi:MAG: ATP-binding protein [Luminiphilus sp.]|nr:ATP-binding protein [Luminiphilus sp.]MDG1461547.1 ATP-binding protein [Luminiphilus sp.]